MVTAPTPGGPAPGKGGRWPWSRMSRLPERRPHSQKLCPSPCSWQALKCSRALSTFQPEGQGHLAGPGLKPRGPGCRPLSRGRGPSESRKLWLQSARSPAENTVSRRFHSVSTGSEGSSDSQDRASWAGGGGSAFRAARGPRPHPPPIPGPRGRSGNTRKRLPSPWGASARDRARLKVSRSSRHGGGREQSSRWRSSGATAGAERQSGCLPPWLPALHRFPVASPPLTRAQRACAGPTPGARGPRTYLGECPGRGALRVLPAPRGRPQPRPPPPRPHRRRRPQGSAQRPPGGGAVGSACRSLGVSRGSGRAPARRPWAQGARSGGRGGVRPSVRPRERAARLLPRPLRSDLGRAGRLPAPPRPAPACGRGPQPLDPAAELGGGCRREAGRTVSGMEGEREAGGEGAARTQLRPAAIRAQPATPPTLPRRAPSWGPPADPGMGVLARQRLPGPRRYPPLQPLKHWGACARTHRGMSSRDTHKQVHGAHTVGRSCMQPIHKVTRTRSTHALTCMTVANAQGHTHSYMYIQGSLCTYTPRSQLVHPSEFFSLAHQACALTHMPSPPLAAALPSILCCSVSLRCCFPLSAPLTSPSLQT